MVHYNYPYKQYIYIAAAYNEGKIDEANKLLSDLNRITFKARVSNNNKASSKKNLSVKHRKVVTSNP